jgi:hypothetical protein
MRKPLGTIEELEAMLETEDLRQREALRIYLESPLSAPAKFPAWLWYPITVFLGLLFGYGLGVWLRIF